MYKNLLASTCSTPRLPAEPLSLFLLVNVMSAVSTQKQLSNFFFSRASIKVNKIHDQHGNKNIKKCTNAMQHEDWASAPENIFLVQISLWTKNIFSRLEKKQGIITNSCARSYKFYIFSRWSPPSRKQEKEIVNAGFSNAPEKPSSTFMKVSLITKFSWRCLQPFFTFLP